MYKYSAICLSTPIGKSSSIEVQGSTKNRHQLHLLFTNSKLLQIPTRTVIWTGMLPMQIIIVRELFQRSKVTKKQKSFHISSYFNSTCIGHQVSCLLHRI